MTSLDRLTGFYWVARTEGYARAVRSFPYPITEPGIHQQVRRLETELGVRLFTVGLGGPDYDLSSLKKWIDWRDSLSGA